MANEAKYLLFERHPRCHWNLGHRHAHRQQIAIDYAGKKTIIIIQSIKMSKNTNLQEKAAWH